jgi:hypothetical protein
MQMTSPVSGLRCRQIAEADIPAVSALLARGFHKRSIQFWERALDTLGKREPPPSFPKYGYLIERNGIPVGALLIICATLRTGKETVTRCNFSSWYVEPEFRVQATLLVSMALRRKDVTYVNVSPAQHTLPIIEAQGFSRYCDGVFMAVPLLSPRVGSEGDRARIFDVHEHSDISMDSGERDVLLDHASLGCTSLWCQTPERAYPFIFRRRVVKGVIPCMQLVYCREVADFVRFASPLGRFLALRGGPLVMIDANGPVPGLVGKFFRDKMPKYFRGSDQPRLGDLAYTEIAVLGV